MKKNSIFMAILLGLACMPFAIESHPPTKREAKRVFRDAPNQFAHEEISLNEYAELVRFANDIGGFIQRPYHDPLHVATCSEDVDLVRDLLARGANPQFVGPSGETALEAVSAASYNNQQIAGLFGINADTAPSLCILY
jgi:ankyrin repeat protein